ncbi:pyruvate ferredoxin oxidoreductase, alpha subunit [Thermosulfidibacter takaii ABI70S6]|uniref:Pyruvate ferredoxin oxidoreductase, alpha subunit n=1 Tax=Thermosulfidibacter takaii (strain DSM 17441 / JCM 13301 / NBRC 103674 / ABI70S6) TaxID=1298851 RepID=A0A0S3QTZ7_THET7|nr:hypothetical protein [Thermosulfidibacter takaii]BAT71795.1 pyruvate ferredoxin oxidoreductase, alpha subunit [Thermosulfidibacter takaii ABI70S6]
MKKLLTSAEAIAHALLLIKPEVISAYPITPQTPIIEKIAQYVEAGMLDAEFVRVESEISALAVVIGSVAQGIRAFTATSSQGLLYMHELLHWAAGGRLPIVMAVANRAVGAPWNIWCDQQDMMAQRDTGWMQIYASNATEAQDFTVISYRVSEEVFIPTMVGIDGFILSHTAEPVDVLDYKGVENFLPHLDFPLRLTHQEPFTLWPILEPALYHRQRNDLFKDMKKAIEVWERAFSDFAKLTGRKYYPVEEYGTDNAHTLFVCTGAIAETTKYVVKKLRERGEKVGLATVKLLRPLPVDHIRNLAVKAERLIVLDRAVSYGNEGILSQEIRAAISGAIPVYPCVVSMGGREIYPRDLEEIYTKTSRMNEGEVLWI